MDTTFPDWISLAGFLAATFAAAMTGGLFRPGAWYRTLRKPGWTPPNRAFPIVWTLLYLALAMAAWRVALSGAASPLVAAGLAFWSCQLVLNAMWSPTVFGIGRLGAGVVVLAALWITAAITLLLFFRIDTLAGWLLAPYLLWLTIAGALNYSIWRLNPDASRPASATS